MLVVARDTGRALLCWRTDTLQWATPGGHLEPGERPLDAAVRELSEETGYAGELSGVVVLESSERFVLYLAHVPREFRVRLNHEHLMCGWFSPDELPRPLYPGLLDYLRLP